MSYVCCFPQGLRGSCAFLWADLLDVAVISCYNIKYEAKQPHYLD